jgi:hypothetical protein
MRELSIVAAIQVPSTLIAGEPQTPGRLYLSAEREVKREMEL